MNLENLNILRQTKKKLEKLRQSQIILDWHPKQREFFKSTVLSTWTELETLFWIKSLGGTFKALTKKVLKNMS